MKLVSSVVRASKLDDVKRALQDIQVDGVCVGERHDYAPQHHDTTVWMGRERSIGYSTKVQIDVVVHDDQVDEVVAVIVKAARTGWDGDGHVMVLPLEHRYNVHTGYRDVL